MSFRLDEEQRLLQQTARELFSKRSPVSRVRSLAEGPGHSEELWRELAELGWVGLAFPEELEGSGLGHFELAILLEEAGRQLAPEPFIASVLLGGMALLHGENAGLRQTWLPAVARGEARLGLAWQEAGSRYDAQQIETRAEAVEGGWRLHGSKLQVMDGGTAQALVVSARLADGGIALFLVESQADGVRCTRQQLLDGRRADLLELEAVQVGPAQLVAGPETGAALLERVLDLARVGLCAEMLGGMSRAFEDTLAYLQSRVQFGVPIGSFQALQHRAARLFCALEMARTAVLAAARCADQRPEKLPELASLAKARCSETYLLVGYEGVQLFGGAGMTEEVDIGLFLKRAAVAAVSLGDAAWHRARWAGLKGY